MIRRRELHPFAVVDFVKKETRDMPPPRKASYGYQASFYFFLFFLFTAIRLVFGCQFVCVPGGSGGVCPRRVVGPFFFSNHVSFCIG